MHGSFVFGHFFHITQYVKSDVMGGVNEEVNGEVG